ncbi:MAG: DNA translocase FtsK [Armatimonadaceae bacterium]
MAVARPNRVSSSRRSSSARTGDGARRKTNDRLPYDIAIVSLITIALILLVTLLLPAANSGENVFGTAVIRGMRLVVGDGAWAFPLVLLFSGWMLATQQSRSWDNIGGGVALFLIFVTWWHLGHVPVEAQFAVENLLNFGGFVGAGLSWLLRAAVGTIGGHIFLGALTVVAFLYLTDIPLSRLVAPIDWLIHRFASASRAGGAAVVDRARIAAREHQERRASTVAEPDTEKARGKEKSRPRLFSLRGKAEDAEDDGEKSTFSADDTVRATPTEATESAEPRRSGVVLRRRKPEPDATVEVVHQPDAEKTTEVKNSAAPLPPVAAAASAAGEFVMPPLDLLQAPTRETSGSGESEERRGVLLQTLEDFGIGADIENIAHGPTITRYEIALDRGIKVNKIVSLADNLAMALAAIDVRIEAPIPGKSAIGIEVPNVRPTLVTLREVIDRPEFWDAPGKLTFALGKDVTGACCYANLAKMPHLLIGGSTGSGKSSGLNALITSLLYRCSPRELKFLMIDPKKVELSLYDGIPHLAAPVITDVKQAPGLFKQAINEMETRYDRFAKAQTRNIEGYNAKVAEEDKLPYWVIVVDELADLMMTSGPEIETSICRLAQLARATGIHLVIATQRPSVNVITGTIKANISSRIAFAVNSAVDSRTILDMVGADRLLGRGDMLFMPMDAAKPTRIQGCFVSEEETHALVSFLREQDGPKYDVLPSTLAAVASASESAVEDADDELFESAVRLVVTGGSASTSMLQRRFKVGYTRAARLVDLMEQRGIVGVLDGAKPREILVTRDEVDAMFRETALPDGSEDEE